MKFEDVVHAFQWLYYLILLWLYFLDPHSVARWNLDQLALGHIMGEGRERVPPWVGALNGSVSSWRLLPWLALEGLLGWGAQGSWRPLLDPNILRTSERDLWGKLRAEEKTEEKATSCSSARVDIPDVGFRIVQIACQPSVRDGNSEGLSFTPF